MATAEEEGLDGQVKCGWKSFLQWRSPLIDGRKQWYCRFCSETNVWTRSKCRRCQTNTPSVLQGKHKQAVSKKGGRSWSESSSSGECEDRVLAHKAQ